MGPRGQRRRNINKDLRNWTPRKGILFKVIWAANKLLRRSRRELRAACLQGRAVPEGDVLQKYKWKIL